MGAREQLEAIHRDLGEVLSATCLGALAARCTRELPALDAAHAVEEWDGTLKFVRGYAADCVRAAGTSIESARALVRAYDLASSALALLPSLDLEHDGARVIFTDARAA